MQSKENWADDTYIISKEWVSVKQSSLSLFDIENIGNIFSKWNTHIHQHILNEQKMTMV